MRLDDLAKGGATFLCVIVAGYLSTTSVDRRFVAQEISDATASPSPPASPEATPTPGATPAPSPNSSACVGEGGNWKNWPWPNVPTLSPKCPPEQK